MSQNKKNIRKELEEQSAYTSGKMTAEERNSFERRMQEDPFLFDALDGLSLLSKDEADKDIKQLTGRLSKRLRRKNRYIYRIAAVLILIIGVSSVLLLRDLRQPSHMLAENVSEEKKESAMESLMDPSELTDDISDFGLKESKQELKSVADEKLSFTAEPAGGGAETDNEILLMDEGMDDQKEMDLFVEGVEVAAPVKAVEAEALMLAEEMKIVEAEEEALMITGKEEVEGEALMIAEREEAEAIGAVAGLRQDETARIKSAGKAKIRAAEMALEMKDSDAGPAGGMDDYNIYLSDNQVFPENYDAMNRAVVKLEFIIRANGIIDSVRVLRSPAEPFSVEAIRLVKEGPEWKPAFSNNIALDEVVNLKIIFHRE